MQVYGDPAGLPPSLFKEEFVILHDKLKSLLVLLLLRLRLHQQQTNDLPCPRAKSPLAATALVQAHWACSCAQGGYFGRRRQMPDMLPS